MVYIKLMLTAIFWGGTFIAGRIVAQNVGPFSAAFFRFAIASLCLLAYTYWKERRLPALPKQQLGLLLLLGLTGIFAYNVFFLKGLKLIEAGRASVIVANNPIIIALFSAYFFKERLTPMRILAIILSVSGAIVVITHGNPLSMIHSGLGTGELYIFGCVASWVAYSLIGKIVMKTLSPLLAVTFSVFIGTALLTPAAYFEGALQTAPTYSFAQWAGIAYLGVFGTVLGFVWYYQGIREIGPTRAGLFINFVPVSAIILSILILHEPMTWSLAAGVALVSSGVYLMNRK